MKTKIIWTQLPQRYTYLQWALVALGITGVILNINKLPICFLPWFVANIGLAWINYRQQQYPQMFLWIVYATLSVYGFVRWTYGCN